MYRIKDEGTGVIHYEFPLDPHEIPDEETPFTPYCYEDLGRNVDYTEDSVTCEDCLARVAMYAEHGKTFKIGDFTFYQTMYAVVKEIDPSYGVILFECQDGLCVWSEPDEEIKTIAKDKRPPMLWRIQKTPHLGRYVFWVGPNFGSARGAILKGEVYTWNKLLKDPLEETQKMLDCYIKGCC